MHPLNISKDNLEYLYLNQKLSDSEIGKIHKVSLGRIHRLRNKYNISTIENYQRHHKQNLSLTEKEFLIGTLLGDGHLRWRNKTSKKSYPQLMLEQSIKHHEYIIWLKDQMNDWLFNPKKELKQITKPNKKTNKTYYSYAFTTICHPVFIEFYNGFYKDKKSINIEFISKYFSKLSLAVWLMDDGTISKNRNIMLCSHNFTKMDNELLSKFLNDKFNLSSNIWKSKDKYYLGFSKENSIKLTNLIKNLVIPSMQYKLISQ